MANLCYINITEAEPSRAYLEIVRKVFDQISRSDTNIDIKSVGPGLSRVFDPLYSYFALLNKVAIIDKIIEAEREGYDAVVVGCFLDPGVREAREIVNIPVIGLAESSMIFACLLGHRFAIVTLNERKAVPDLENEIRTYGLESRAITNPIRMITMPTMQIFTKGLEQPEIVAADILEQSRKCVPDGAEVIVVGCNGLGPLCTISNVTEVEESHVPILDCVSVAVKVAETLVDSRTSLRIPVPSRAGLYMRPTEKAIKRVRTVFGLE